MSASRAETVKQMKKNLPWEAEIEILSWLPVKSLLRFRCVSKTWLQLLSTDPNFMKLHLDRSIQSNKNKNPSVLVARKENEIIHFLYIEDCNCTNFDEGIWFKSPNLPNSLSQRYSIAGICNGLVCLADFNFKQEDNSDAYLWNPLIGDHITIPCPPLPSDFIGHAKNFTFRFGFHEGSKEYKLIRIVSLHYPPQKNKLRSHVSVYTLGTDSWRTLQDVPYYIRKRPFLAVLNGVCHWFADSSVGGVIVSFDIKDEVFGEIPLPNGISYDDRYALKVWELGGMLSIFHIHQREFVQIWVMNEYGVVDSWAKRYEIRKSEIPGPFYLYPVDVTKDEDIIIKQGISQLVLWNPKTNSVRSVNKFEFPVFYTHTFKGSLISPTIIYGARGIIDANENGS